MKFCEVCGEEIATPDGENRCQRCEEIEDASVAVRARRAASRRAREAALRSCGLVKVRGAMGGTYWE